MTNKGQLDSAQGLAWKRKLREEQEWEGEDFGPVTWEELSNMRRNSVILFNSELYPNKISEWSLRAEPNRDTKYYICVLCRKLQDRGKRLTPPVKFGSPARILVRNGRFLTHPDYPRTPHICNFADNPMSDRAAVLARRAMIRARTEISEDGMKPKEKVNQILASFRENEKYSNLSAGEVEQMEDIILGHDQGRVWSESRIARSLYINRRKLIGVNSNDKPLKVYECPIVDCDFVTSATGMIDVHMSEKHRAADENFVVAETANIVEEVSGGNREISATDLPEEDMHNNVVWVYPPSQVGLEQNSICEPEGDYGPVIHEALSCQRRKSIILFESKRFPNKISEWALKMPVNDTTMYYTCVLCRKLKDKGKRQEPSVHYPPPARIMVRNGRFMVHPDYPRTPHICDFENNPLSDRQSVLSRRSLARKPVNETYSYPVQKTLTRSTFGRTNYHFSTIDPSAPSVFVANDPKAWPQDCELSLSDDSDGEYEFLSNDMDQTVASAATSELPCTSADFTDNSMKSCPVYNCSIVGCDFTTSAASDLDVHLHEHELLDEQVELFEEGDCTYENIGDMNITDDLNISEPFRKRRKIISEDHILLEGSNEVDYKEFEKSDLPTDVPPTEENQRTVDDLHCSIRQQLQDIDRSLVDLRIGQLLEIDEYLACIRQKLQNAASIHYVHEQSSPVSISPQNVFNSPAELHDTLSQ